MPRFYTPLPLAIDQTFEPDAGLTRHLQVTRAQPGDFITLFNGDGHNYSATVVEMGKRHSRLTVTGQTANPCESPLETILVQSVASNDHLDYALQKAVECGVSQIDLVWAERSQGRLSGERLEKRMQHWQGVVLAACEQSGRSRVPALNAPQSLEARLAQPDDTTRYILAPGGLTTLQQLPASCARVSVLVGPEGGFTAREQEQATAAGWLALMLGPRVLRTETAGPVALALLQARWGDY